MTNIKNKTFNSLILAALVTVVSAGVLTDKANATCEQRYGGGETCVVTSTFKIRKYVRLEGDKSWRDEVTIDLNDGDENDKKIEFKVEVTAEISDSHNVDLDKITFDDLKMKDSWPEELKFLDESDDDLKEEWDDFKAGDKKTFRFTGKIQGDEKDKDGEFEKCVVNKASLYYEDEFQASDEAVVCYKKTEDVLGTSTVAELPKTGLLPIPAILGVALLSASGLLKLARKK